MPRSIWNGVITFGMVSIPVKLYTATESHDMAFHQLHDVCDTRIKYQKYCPHCERTVENEEIEKGYEYARGEYVVLDDEDFEQVPLPSKHAIYVSAFVKSEAIDPIYYEKPYYIEPDEAAIRPFTLFMKALTEKQMVGIATITLRNKERLCALRELNGTLVLDTLLYPDEIRVGEETAAATVKVSEKELKLAEHLIELMQQDFDPAQYEDHYRDALQKVIEAKLAGKEVVVEEGVAPRGKVIDLMDALRASVENIQQQGKPSLKSAAKQAKARIDDAEERASKRKPHVVEKKEAGAENGPKRRPKKTAAHTAKTKRTGSTSRRRKASA
jgi:DNA end-binding protein Ku